MKPAKRVAVIGLGPAGAIAIDALAQEKAFDTIRVFERREAPGGCWLGEAKPPPVLQPDELLRLASRTADPPHPAIPAVLPARVPEPAAAAVPRYAESTVYPYLETNVDYVPMQYTQEPFPAAQTELSRALHGEDTPFPHWSLVRDYVRSLVERRGYRDLVSYNTTVERAEKVPCPASSAAAGDEEWKLTLRRGDPDGDGDGGAAETWWEERFDALVVASGHYSVPYVPPVPGLAAFAAARPGSVIHSKHYRGRDAYAGRRVVVVGASVSAADIAFDLASNIAAADDAHPPVTAVVVGHAVNGYFGGEAFEHPLIRKATSIARVDPATRTVHFVDGTSVAAVDDIIFGTGYTWTLPFFQASSSSSSSSDPAASKPKTPPPAPRNNRIPHLYLHTIYTPDPTVCFVGAVNAGLTFKIFEYQAVLAARLLAGRVPPHRLPPAEAQRAWEADRVARRGDGPAFALVYPDFEDYFEAVRALAGPPAGAGRPLPPFNPFWLERFMRGHERRKAMWRRLNAEAREALASRRGHGAAGAGAGAAVRAKL